MLGNFGRSILDSNAGRAAANFGLNAAGLGMQGWSGAGRLMGQTGRMAAVGGLAGAGWGMMSGDTSVIGGAMMGAGLAAGGYRYGRPGVMGAMGALRPGVSLRHAAKVGAGFAYAGMKSDALALYGRGTTLASNLGNSWRARPFS